MLISSADFVVLNASTSETLVASEASNSNIFNALPAKVAASAKSVPVALAKLCMPGTDAFICVAVKPNFANSVSRANISLAVNAVSEPNCLACSERSFISSLLPPLMALSFDRLFSNSNVIPTAFLIIEPKAITPPASPKPPAMLPNAPVTPDFNLPKAEV